MRPLSIADLESMLATDERLLAPIAAGVVVRAPSGMILFLKRGPNEKNYADHWCLPGGGIDDGESPKAAAMREVREETGLQTGDNLFLISEVETGSGNGTFMTFGFDAADEFKPTLADQEHVAYAWAPASAPPLPIHPGVAKLLRKIKNQDGQDFKINAKTDQASLLALDRDSVRDKDQYGRLHVAKSNIGKACVSPYKGHEIPDWETLGLDPNRIYHLLRDPDELAKAAPSFNRVQILRKHAPVDALDAQQWDVVGCTGSECEFDGEFLTNSLSIWVDDAIADIEDESKKELSPGYGYRADMTAGNFRGTAYDGVMRDIVGNHVALVKNGRAGPDVVVGDSNQEIDMSNRELAKTIKTIAMRTTSINALHRYLRPRMAMDGALPFAKIFDGVPVGPKFKELRPKIEERIRGLKLAQDASIESLGKVLDLIESHEIDGTDESVSEPQHNAMAAAAQGESELGIPEKVGEEFLDADKGKGFDEHADLRAFLAEQGMAEDTINMACSKLKNGGANDEFPPKKDDDKDKDDDGEKDDDAEVKAKDADMAKKDDEKPITKQAMDEALKANAEEVRKQVIREQRGIHDAREAVRPYVGELTMAFDSGEQVYRHALGMLGVEGAKTIHESALPALLKAQPKAGAKPVDRKSDLAMDESTMSAFEKRFPNASRIQAA